MTHPPVRAERADTRPVHIETRDPKWWRVSLIVGLGATAVAIAGLFLWGVTQWS